MLLGDGKGHFTAMAGQDSGINVFGDQRGAAVGDFDDDGNLDIAVTSPPQNKVMTLLGNGSASFSTIPTSMDDAPVTIAAGDFTGARTTSSGPRR